MGYELDTVRFKHDKKADYMHRIDEQVVADASKAIHDNAPDLFWVYLEYTDDMGHAHGDSPEFYKAIGMLDKQVGKIWDAINYRQQNFKEDWLIVITTDGIPFIRPVSIAGLKTIYTQNRIDISWQALQKAGKLKVWVATTNNFKTGDIDGYHLLGEIDLSLEHFLADVKPYPSSFYKIVLEAPANTLNKWVKPTEKSK